MTFYHTHRATADTLEELLNRHAEKQWELHHVRGIGHGAQHLLVLFRRDFTNAAQYAQYLHDRDARRRESARAREAARVAADPAGAQAAHDEAVARTLVDPLGAPDAARQVVRRHPGGATLRRRP